ncbi:MAG: hypothetical protein HY054_15940 [Proteobacteria bacterium]|nr:hypothetical protein [Pseudomonadota bacterium]
MNGKNSEATQTVAAVSIIIQKARLAADARLAYTSSSFIAGLPPNNEKLVVARTAMTSAKRMRVPSRKKVEKVRRPGLKAIGEVESGEHCKREHEDSDAQNTATSLDATRRRARSNV